MAEEVNISKLIQRINNHLEERDRLVDEIKKGVPFETLFHEDIHDHIIEADNLTSDLYRYVTDLAQSTRREIRRFHLLTPGTWLTSEEELQKLVEEDPTIIRAAKIRNLTDKLLKYHGQDMEHMRLASTYEHGDFGERTSSNRKKTIGVTSELMKELRK